MDLYAIRKKLNMGINLSSLNLKVTFYARVSTDHLDQQNSLQNQKDYFTALIKNNKNWQYIPGYIDEGISGTSIKKRDSFLKMIDDAKTNKFDLIVTKEISRFSRNTLDSIKYTRELLSYGVAVLFINDNINTLLSDSELRLTIMASMAQDEIRRLSERVKFGMNQAINKGTILGNDMLYGYKKDRNTGNLYIIQDEAIIVQKMYYLYGVKNYSINKIVNILNKEGLKTRQNNKWCTSTISRMLRNPKYKGFYCGRKSEIIDYMTKQLRNNPQKEWVLYKDEDKIPPIIDEKLWNKVNKKLTKKY
ncbi:MAG: recombinase family protein [Bacilli bacterium]|nr:recombinase family protein [Bacilli bacterium]